MTFAEAMALQAAYCDANGAPITARACRSIAEALTTGSVTGRRAIDWPGDYVQDALPLRLVAPFHALHRAGRAELGCVFARAPGDPVAAIRAAVAEHDVEIARWLDGPPQTNEAARSAGFVWALLMLADRFGLPFEMLEIGSSAGLNLLIDRYAYDLDGVQVGPGDSPVRIVPEWRAPTLPDAEVRFASVRGVDIAPLDLGDDAAVERLTAYAWADAPERIARIDAAAAMWRERPARLDQGDAADWVEGRLAEPQAEGVTRVFVHSIVWPYLPPETRTRITRAIEAAGAQATAKRPPAWVRYEWGASKLAAHEVRVRSWPGGEDVLLGRAHPHGAWFDGE